MIVVALLVALPAAASADPPATVDGSFIAPPPAPTSVHEAGQNCFVQIDDDTFVLTGDVQGDLVLDFMLVFHRPCAEFPGLPANFRASAEFSGTVTIDGSAHEGSFTGAFNGRISEQGLAAGRLVVLHGTGGLEGLHGVVELQGFPGVGGDYSGELHLDP